jgi:hypothetical protein
MTASIPLMTACPPLMIASVALMTAPMFEMGVPIVRVNPRELGMRAPLAFMRSLQWETDPRVHLADALTPFIGALARGMDALVDVTDTHVRELRSLSSRLQPIDVLARPKKL